MFTLEPLPKAIYEDLTELGVKTVTIQFERGIDGTHIYVRAGIDELDIKIEDWAREAYSRDIYPIDELDMEVEGNEVDHVNEVIYNLVDNTVTIQERHRGIITNKQTIQLNNKHTMNWLPSPIQGPLSIHTAKLMLKPSYFLQLVDQRGCVMLSRPPRQGVEIESNLLPWTENLKGIPVRDCTTLESVMDFLNERPDSPVTGKRFLRCTVPRKWGEQCINPDKSKRLSVYRWLRDHGHAVIVGGHWKLSMESKVILSQHGLLVSTFLTF